MNHTHDTPPQDSATGGGFDWKQHKSAIIALCIVGGLIYYFGYMQPANIREQCARSAERGAISMCQERNAQYQGACTPTFGTSTTYLISDYNAQYAQCLTENGVSSGNASQSNSGGYQTPNGNY